MGYADARKWVVGTGASALMVGLALAGSPGALAQTTSAPVVLTGSPVDLHDGSCANPIVEPEFPLGSLEPEPYAQAIDDFRRDALDEDVPADVQVPGVAPALIDEDLDNDGVLDADEDLDADGVLDVGFDADEDGALAEDELLAGDPDAAVLLLDFPTVWKVEEEIDATFEEIFAAVEDGAEEDADDQAIDDPGIVAVHASSEDYGTIVACGELTAPAWEDESDVVIGIRPVDGSAVYGFAVYGFAVFERDTGNIPIFGENTTGVTVYLFQNLDTARSERMAEATPTP